MVLVVGSSSAMLLRRIRRFDVCLGDAWLIVESVVSEWLSGGIKGCSDGKAVSRDLGGEVKRPRKLGPVWTMEGCKGERSKMIGCLIIARIKLPYASVAGGGVVVVMVEEMVALWVEIKGLLIHSSFQGFDGRVGWCQFLRYWRHGFSAISASTDLIRFLYSCCWIHHELCAYVSLSTSIFLVQTLLDFATCPTSHMFEPGFYGLFERVGTLVYKGTLFAAVGFVAGLGGTALSNGLIAMRRWTRPQGTKQATPEAVECYDLGHSYGYQTLNGIEFVLANGVSPVVFKTSVVVLRCLNNILGGMSFVMLARLTGSQSVSDQEGKMLVAEDGTIIDKHKLLNEVVADDNLLHNDSSSK
ncbi:hypothetical protein Leryth_023666 [Lithospermum erythrorhizon]|nr:hypothetical protein Leryth_023666 [Lithospermum erythrorhizon]